MGVLSRYSKESSKTASGTGGSGGELELTVSSS